VNCAYVIKLRQADNAIKQVGYNQNYVAYNEIQTDLQLLNDYFFHYLFNVDKSFCINYLFINVTHKQLVVNQSRET